MDSEPKEIAMWSGLLVGGAAILKVIKDLILGSNTQVYERLSKLEKDNEECMDLHSKAQNKIGNLEAHVAHCTADHRKCEESVVEIRHEANELRAKVQDLTLTVSKMSGGGHGRR